VIMALLKAVARLRRQLYNCNFCSLKKKKKNCNFYLP
jgi:hypothetical protein